MEISFPRTESGKFIARHIINGNGTIWGSMMEVFNPANGEVIGYLPASLPLIDLEELNDSAKRAQECWYHEVTEQEKELVFRSIIAEIERHRGALTRTMVLEGGKLWRWADAEVQETIDTLWHYHGEISRCYTHDGFTRCQMPDKNAFSILKPYGVVLGITPWNFPLAVPFWKICGALAGGNAIVLKDAEQTPFTAEIAVGLIIISICKVITDEDRRKRLRGLVQLVHGKGETSGKLLLEQLDYDKVAFTGSVETGKIVASTAGSRLKPGHMELGGHAAMVVLDDFDIDLAIAEAINANLGDSGQRCVSARVVFVQESKHEEFVKKYIKRARDRIIGNPMDFSTEMGPLISMEQWERVDNQVAKTANEINNVTHTGILPNLDGPRKGYYYSPTVFLNVPYGMTAMDEEIFGPVIVINSLQGKNREEAFWNAVELVNHSKYGLSNALLTNDRRLSSRAPWRFKTGLLYIGRGTTGAELNKYFGGVKSSGWGREGRGLDDWTQITEVYDDHHGKLRMAQAGADERVKKMISEARSPLEI